MSLWKSTDLATSAPKFDTFSGLGVSANGQELFANTDVNVFLANTALGCNGMSAVEKTSVSGPAHAGWVNEKRGTGGIQSIAISNNGTGYSGNGFLTITGGGTGNTSANVSYVVSGGSIVSVALVSGGVNYKTTPTVNAVAAFTVQAQFVVTMGGRANRVQYETIAAMGSIA